MRRLFVVIVAFLLGAEVVHAAESWVFGTGGNRVVAKEAALATASANLPLGIAFYVANENFVGDDYKGYTCNILVRYGTGVVVPGGVAVYHATPRAIHEARATSKASKQSAKATKAPAKSTKPPKAATKTAKAAKAAK